MFFFQNIQNLVEDDFINVFIGQTQLRGNSHTVTQREIFGMALKVFARGAENS